jgi:superfamily I DNA and/or RNA helicase
MVNYKAKNDKNLGYFLNIESLHINVVVLHYHFKIIIDEAGMCPEPYCLVPIIATKPEQVVLIGDHKQLRPIIMCKRAAELGLDKSLFERYAHNHLSTNVSFVMLNEQYRMVCLVVIYYATK